MDITRDGMTTGLQGIDAVVLAGGLGTRISSILGDTPKILAPIGKQTFLDLLLAHLSRAGIGRVILSLGHLADKVVAHLQETRPPVPVETVIEATPLGTAGAIRLAASATRSDPILIMNGDTWLKADFSAFLAGHRRSGREVSMLAVEVGDIARFGSLDIAADGTVSAFVEKGRTGSGVINGGMYLLSRRALEMLEASRGSSLERDFLALLPSGSIHAHVASGATFIDIGTPESLSQADAVITGVGKDL